tara:strand:- start:493 stop:708 length:216 start_codon:yes stop_codon:yes gene_type:complete
MVIKFFLVGFFCIASEDCTRISGASSFNSYEECAQYAYAIERNILDYVKDKPVDIDLSCVDAYELPRINFI